MNLVFIIPARGGSKGISKKNIIDFCGNPLIVWSIGQAINSKYFNNNIYVTSDSDEILDISYKFGAKKIKRPEELSSDISTTESALIHAVDYIEELENKNVDVVVLLQATSPIRESIDIDNTIDVFINKNLDSVFSSCELEDFFIWNTDKDENFNSLNYDYKNRKRRQDISKQYVENGSIYVFKKNILKEKNNRLGGKIGISTMENWKMYEIDNLEDLETCKFFFEKKILNNGK